MENSIIPTAEELANGICSRTNPKNQLIVEALINFAKLHVEAALKEASNKLRQASGTFNSDYNEQKISILNSYPLENIK